MNSPQEHINIIQDKLSTLVEKYQVLLKENERLKKNIQESSDELHQLKERNNEMTLQLNLLKAAESEDAKEAKMALEKKINEYIKEIDKCIAHLGDQH